MRDLILINNNIIRWNFFRTKQDCWHIKIKMLNLYFLDQLQVKLYFSKVKFYFIHIVNMITTIMIVIM